MSQAEAANAAPQAPYEALNVLIPSCVLGVAPACCKLLYALPMMVKRNFHVAAPSLMVQTVLLFQTGVF
jgi:hypothetical protein